MLSCLKHKKNIRDFNEETSKSLGYYSELSERVGVEINVELGKFSQKE